MEFGQQGIHVKDIRKKFLNYAPFEFGLSDEERVGPLGVFGATRTGKTRLAELIVEQDIKDGKNVVIFVAKPDQDLLKRVVETAEKTKRWEDLFVFTTNKPHLSVRLNPLYGLKEIEEVIAPITASMSVGAIDGESQFFINAGRETCLAVTRSLQVLDTALGIEPWFNIDRISSFIAYETITGLLDRLNDIAMDKTIAEKEIDGVPIKTIIEKEIKLRMQFALQSGREHFAKLSGQLRTTLSQLTIGTLGTLIARPKGNPIYERLFKEGKRIIFYVEVSGMKTPDLAKIVSRMLLGMLVMYGSMRFENGQAFDPPMSITIDEGKNLLYRGIDNMFNKAGGAKMLITLMTQSSADITDEMGVSFTRLVMDNLHHKIFFKVNDIDSSKYLATMINTRSGEVKTIGQHGMSLREQEKKIVPDNILLKLKPQEIFFIKGTRDNPTEMILGKVKNVATSPWTLSFENKKENISLQEIEKRIEEGKSICIEDLAQEVWLKNMEKYLKKEEELKDLIQYDRYGHQKTSYEERKKEGYIAGIRQIIASYEKLLREDEKMLLEEGIKILQEKGNMPSVLGGDIKGNASYEALKQVSLAEHIYDTLLEGISFLQNEVPLWEPSAGKFLLAFLWHDLGKTVTEEGSSRAIHAIESAKLLIKRHNELGLNYELLEEVTEAIRDHHTVKLSDELPTLKRVLIIADREARKAELLKLGEIYTPFGDEEERERKEASTFEERKLDIPVEEILKTIEPLVNVEISPREMKEFKHLLPPGTQLGDFLAFSQKDGIVYVRPRLIVKAIQEIAKQNNIKENWIFEENESGNLLFWFKKKIEEMGCLVEGHVGEKYVGRYYEYEYKNVRKKLKGFFVPIKGICLGDVGRLEERRMNSNLKQIKRVTFA